jgi:hypothetical protein
MLTRSILDFFLFVSLAVPFSAHSQNLVPNGSFEEAIFCPELLGDLHFGCAEWYAGIQPPGTDPNDNPSPDWFHTCAPNVNFSPPSTLVGYQFPCDQNGYAGIVTYDTSGPEEYREILSVELLTELDQGSTYNLTFQVVCSGKLPLFGYCSNKLGVKFSTFPFYSSHESAITNWSHLVVDELISDTTNWNEFSFDFISDSSYKFLHLGNFYDDQNIVTINFSEGPSSIQAYYFIDCVELTEMGPSSSLNESYNAQMVFPNPSKDYIRISDDLLVESLSIFDASGRIVYQLKNPLGKSLELNISHLSDGFYFLAVNDGMDNVRTFKIIKTK